VDQLDAALELECRLLILRRLLRLHRHDEKRERGNDGDPGHWVFTCGDFAWATGRSRRSMCGTIRSAVRKLTRYRPTSAAFGIVTANGDSAPASSAPGRTGARPLAKNPPSRL